MSDEAMIGGLPDGQDRAQWLLSFLLDQPLEGYERSIKFGRNMLLDQRFLGGIAFSRLQRAGVLAICDRLGMPQPLLALLAGEADEPDVVHFGYEGGAGQEIFKVYFEFAHRARALETGAGFVLHRAFKWDACAPTRYAIATYRCIPGLDQADLHRRVANLLAGSAFKGAISEILDLALSRCKVAPMYLEVSEDGNLRASFDINFHGAGLPFAVIRPALVKDSQLFNSLPDGAIERALRPLEDRQLGHLSAGTSRSGEDFFTLYYDPFA